MNNFKVGQTVRLKCGGPKMVISQIHQQDPCGPAWITVTWWHEDANEPRSTSNSELVFEDYK